MDPDGRDITLHYDVKQQTNYYLQYSNAVRYLLSSNSKKLVHTIFQDLRVSDINITINFTIFKDFYNPHNKVINWNPLLTSYNPKTFVYNSPSIALMHELIHAWVDTTENGKNMFNSFLKHNQKNLDGYYEKHLSFFVKIKMSKETFYQESFATTLEQFIGQDLNEESSRKMYFDFDDTTAIHVKNEIDAGNYYER
nr:hypothetical protein [uncultured Treponema sp.]